MKAVLAVIVVVLASWAGSVRAQQTPPPAPPGAVLPPAPGSDRDSHGCIPSAGYQWCAAEGSCVRAWELASKLGLQSGEAAFTKYCTTGVR